MNADVGSEESNKIIIKSDGVRLLWSLLKSSNESVQAMGAMALAPVINDGTNTNNNTTTYILRDSLWYQPTLNLINIVFIYL